jgi:hypothetical protein
MADEQRGQVIAIGVGSTGNGTSPTINGRRQPSRGGTSRMNREVHVRLCEGLAVQFPGPTRRKPTASSRNLGGSHVVMPPVRQLAPARRRKGFTLLQFSPDCQAVVRRSEQTAHVSSLFSALDRSPPPLPWRVILVNPPIGPRYWRRDEPTERNQS